MKPDELINEIKKVIESSKDKIETINQIRRALSELSPLNKNPVDMVLWVDIDKVEANNYNPNQVAKSELRLLLHSIEHDGYTQPVVTVYDEERDKYVIVDGFHRYFVMKSNKELAERNNNKLPITVIKTDINNMMASTIRHNRARGVHKIDGMSNIVFKMLENGWTDEQICEELGMEPEELIKLKHITGFSKLFEDVEFSKAWKTDKQIEIEKQYENQKKKEFEEWLNSLQWTFAKTYKTAPHWYVHLSKIGYQHKDKMVEFAKFIRRFGVEEKFWNKTFKYIYIGDYKYWTMVDDVEATELINRARIEDGNRYK